MRKQLIHILALFVCCIVLLCACFESSKKPAPPFEHFRISFEQNGLKVPLTNKVASLQKKPFTIVISFLYPDGIFVNASLNNETQRQTIEGVSAEEIRGFSPTQIDELFNRDETLFLTDNSAGFWYYAGKNANTFNTAAIENGILECRRNISKINLTDKHNSGFGIEMLQENTIYFSFMKLEWNNDFTQRIEKKRDYYTIRFSNGNN